MNTPSHHITSASEYKVVATWLMWVLAVACGLTVANIYYAQPIAGPISNSLGLSAGATGLIVTLTQIGYGLGLLLIVPLGDLIENRRLTLILLVVAALALTGAGLSTHPLPFLISALCIGVGTVAVQVLVPYAAHMAPEALRGRIVGNVMSGLMLGIMLARPVSSFITQISSWHIVFFISAFTMGLLVLVLAWTMPPRKPAGRIQYFKLLTSMYGLVRTTPVLRRRAIYQAFLFAAFSLFWTVTPLLLAGPEFQLTQGEIALFALAGIAGAIASPFAGLVADRGWTRPATALAMLAVAVSFLITHIAASGSIWALNMLVVAAIVLDFGVAANMTLGQRAIFGLDAQFRSRLNGLYMTTFFIGGAFGSAIGGWVYAHYGWGLTSWVGFILPVLAALYFSTERQG